MPKSIPEQELQTIRGTIPPGDRGLTAQEIAAALQEAVPLRTLQYRLRHLVATGRLEREGHGRWVRYLRPADGAPTDAGADLQRDSVEWEATSEDGESEGLRTYPGILSPRAVTLLRRLHDRPPRRLVGERRRLLDAYLPGGNGYLTRRERARLAALGSIVRDAGVRFTDHDERLELDLIWNAARLSGCRYTEREARRLLKFGRAAEGHPPFDTQSILNHRDALRYLLDASGEVELTPVSLRNLHAILAHNLIPDESMTGRLRVRLSSAASAPLGAAQACPEAIEQDFLRIIKTALAIADPFEQSMFLLVQIPYVAPFAEMNERVALHAANIPLIRAGLIPMSFVDWPGELYADALRGVVERNRVDLLRDLLIWGYQRSAQRYGAGVAGREPTDPFRFAHDAKLRAAVSEAIRQRVARRELPAWLEFRATGGLATELRQRFVGLVTAELHGLHEGNFARYDVTTDEFQAWRAGWLRDCTDIQRLV